MDEQAQKAVYFLRSGVSSQSDGMNCAISPALHKAKSALHHLSECLFSLSTVLDDLFQCENVKRV